MEMDDHLFNFKSQILLCSTYTFVDVYRFLLLRGTDATFFFELGYPLFLEIQEVLTIEHPHLNIILLIMASLICKEF
jgi:hypothetical protein